MSDMINPTKPKSDQMNADSLIGGPRTIKITKVVIKDSAEQPISVFFDGDDGKPWKPCKSMARVMMEVWKSSDSKTYIGKSMTLYRDPEAVFSGAKVGGIRISHMSHIDGDINVMLTVSRGHKKPFTVKPLKTSTAAPIPSDELIDAGNSAAMGGVAAYKAWIATLTDVQKASLNNHHAGWIDVAKKADTPPDGLDEILPPVPDAA